MRRDMLDRYEFQATLRHLETQYAILELRRLRQRAHQIMLKAGEAIDGQQLDN